MCFYYFDQQFETNMQSEMGWFCPGQQEAQRLDTGEPRWQTGRDQTTFTHAEQQRLKCQCQGSQKSNALRELSTWIHKQNIAAESLNDFYSQIHFKFVSDVH